jgi:hypothetical protein
MTGNIPQNNQTFDPKAIDFGFGGGSKQKNFEAFSNVPKMTQNTSNVN